MRYFFVPPEDLGEQTVVIAGQEARHMGKVLRLKPGMVVGLCDGGGLQGEARIAAMTRERVTLEVLRCYPSPREPAGELVVAQALLKDQKMDLLLRQLTELGITGWQPFISQRSVPQPDARRQAGRTERWARIAREAVKQCRRGRVPDLAGVEPFEGVLQCGSLFDERLLFWEGARQALPSLPENICGASRKILMVVGPEGGFTEAEAARADACGFRLTALGPRILRAETAAVAACALVQHLYGDLGRVLDANDAEARGGGDCETLCPGFGAPKTP